MAIHIFWIWKMAGKREKMVWATDKYVQEMIRRKASDETIMEMIEEEGIRGKHGVLIFCLMCVNSFM